MDYTALLSEIQNDPQSIGYAAYVSAGNDVMVATLLNQIRAGGAYQIYRGVIDSYEVINNTAPSEWSALTAAEKQRYQTITGAAKVDTANINVRSNFVSMFSGGSLTRTSLSNMAQRQGSRAEILWGAGITVSSNDIARALGRV